jgi:XTP/dITP diphosphohydrolase
MEIVFCTNNQHKINEVTQIMGDDFIFLTLGEVNFFDEIPEPFLTLEENSLTKSKQVYNKIKMNCFSEDTGLFIDSLNGEPGVFSARYAGEKANAYDNINKVLDLLKGNLNRKAYFKTVITLLLNGEQYQFEGKCDGTITSEINGVDGFGYDPIFIPSGYEQSFAQLSANKKNIISHRGKAFEKFKLFLKS